MADMADMLKSFSSMMEGKQIPDNIKEMLNSLQNNSAQNGANTGNNTTANTTDSNTNSNMYSHVNQANSSESASSERSGNRSSNNGFEQSIPNIDINTMMKMQKIISAMNSPSNNSGVNLLRSLKPYLKPSRQAKVDEYIQLFNMEKVFELMRQSGGDKNGS
ncbi:MAG: hypothetical protein ACLVAK_07210 [Clostridia bacterium]|jgi:hypothetical protein